MPVTCVTKSSRRVARCFGINMNTQVRFFFLLFAFFKYMHAKINLFLCSSRQRIEHKMHSKVKIRPKNSSCDMMVTYYKYTVIAGGCGEFSPFHLEPSVLHYSLLVIFSLSGSIRFQLSQELLTSPCSDTEPKASSLPPNDITVHFLSFARKPRFI